MALRVPGQGQNGSRYGAGCELSIGHHTRQRALGTHKQPKCGSAGEIARGV